MPRKIFSLPFSPYISLEDYELHYLPFVLEHKDYIYDIFTTIRISPFEHDAMGGNFDPQALALKALKVQEDTGVGVSATFNDISIPPTQENLELFLKNFKPLYEAGIHSATIPPFHWMLTGRIQEEFPNLKIKNTVLREVNNAQSYWLAAEAGYDVVNIDRNILRSHDILVEIKKAQTHFKKRYGKAPKTQILANEQCTPHCPVRNEHYSINFTGDHYFGNNISSFSCRSWEKKDPAYDFKRAALSPFKEDIDTLLENVDLLKLFGRDGETMLKRSMALVRGYAQGKEILPTIANADKIENSDKKEFDLWRKTIKNCRFQCWNCHVCDHMVKV